MRSPGLSTEKIMLVGSYVHFTMGHAAPQEKPFFWKNSQVAASALQAANVTGEVSLAAQILDAAGGSRWMSSEVPQ